MWSWPDTPQWSALAAQVTPALEAALPRLSEALGRPTRLPARIESGPADAPLWTLDGDTLSLHPELAGDGVHWSGHQQGISDPSCHLAEQRVVGPPLRAPAELRGPTGRRRGPGWGVLPHCPLRG